MNRKEFVKYREELILSVLEELGPSTMNEIINYIWDMDKERKQTYKRGWRFYVHLNKFPAPMESKKLIKFTGGKRMGDTGIMEKVWRLR